MNNTESREVVQRFFEALRRLKEDRRLRGKKTFADRYGINRRNLWQLERDPSRGILQASWLSRLAADYGVSPRWLLLGEGPFYAPPASHPGG